MVKKDGSRKKSLIVAKSKKAKVRRDHVDLLTVFYIYSL
jgi:hypothetical protein